ncbi:glycerol-3-phosphate dehydrogenase/oxidase [Beijerinckia indica]|uniref:Glycerol-3-phosphate dehydrogenase n=1 Tax=Beijerinckia indica subsp. indica (strain ATCC 9039 / DSM 1715 / NCIMB 8712) TaxID=395963 RepID=B2IE07_BEII9|nr:FAD-dependent oxidoreductase [Beijerinckia indica]ACB94031.1 FAD dependent oxidoreductase [Beijerinckia indica subsp. indica ATCC 9039]
MDRQAALKALQAGETFDLLVVGGGATGCGVALDAASRGLKVALVERNDFAEGTSSKSTKLVHGGARYLELAIRRLDRVQFNLVRDGLRERAIFLKNAPHLAHRLALLSPLYRWFDVPYVFAGLYLYDRLAGKLGLGGSRLLSRAEALRRFPMLKAEGLKAAVLYYDGQFNDARMAVTLALTAVEQGAVIATRLDVVGLTHEKGKLRGATVHDRESRKSFEIKARAIINAGGPFADSLRLMADPETAPILTASSGIHIVLDRRFAPTETGLMIPETEDGRLLFVLPWQGHALIGTTDEPARIEENPQARQEAIDYLLRHVRKYFNMNVTEADLLSVWCGLRPLVSDPKAADTARLARDHIIEVSKSGLVTICGGKWTTYRKMAEQTVDHAIACFSLPTHSKCRTLDLPLVGARHFDAAGGAAALTSTFGLSPETAAHLHQAYGDRAKQVLGCVDTSAMKTLLHPLHPYLEAEVLYSARFEAALSAMDVLARRLPLALLDRQAAREAAPRVIAMLATELAWDEQRCANEAAEVEQRLSEAI